MSNKFEILKEKFEKHTGNASGMELCELDDSEIVFEVKSKDVTMSQLRLINSFLNSLFMDKGLINIECIDNRQFLTYRCLE